MACSRCQKQRQKVLKAFQSAKPLTATKEIAKGIKMMTQKGEITPGGVNVKKTTKTT